ncbi:MAG TPA: terminase family protein [Nitrospira sp.]|nr:terminase family protein [Nitrospira sp.]
MSAAILTPERTDQARQRQYFLPYQQRWLADESQFMIWEKSRRIGATYVVGYGDVRSVIKTPKWPVWFSSADESAAKEYIDYCETWAKVFDVVATNLGEVLLDGKDNVTALTLEFPRFGGRIHALRSNPRGFRSKGGRVRLDEFAFHDDQKRLWAAARPVVTWGGDLKILSTHNGKQSLYFKMLETAKAGKSAFKPHYTDIFLAVREGLADKIAGRTLTDTERAAWIEEQRLSCVDEETWQQEFCCIPVDEATAFLTYDLIEACESAEAGLPGHYVRGDVYAGMDIGRRRDLTVIWVLERVGDVYWTREVVTMKGAKFAAQEMEVARILADYPTLRRLCIDQTGMGEKFVEDVQATHGSGRIEGVVFNNAVKQELAFGLKRRIEDRLIRIPRQAEVRDDFHSVRKVTTAAGNIRFDAERTDQGHADRFFSAALAIHAIDSGPPAAGVSGEAGRLDWTARRQEILSGAGAQRHFDRRGRLWFAGGGRQ